MQVKLVRLDGELSHVEVSGRISRDHWTTKVDPLMQLCGENVYSRTVLMDLGSSAHIDSTGVEWLLMCHRNFRQQGGILVIHSVSRLMDQMLRIMGMHKVLHIASDLETAARMLEELGHPAPGNGKPSTDPNSPAASTTGHAASADPVPPSHTSPLHSEQRSHERGAFDGERDGTQFDQ